MGNSDVPDPDAFSHEGNANWVVVYKLCYPVKFLHRVLAGQIVNENNSDILAFSVQRTTSPSLRIVFRSLCSGVSCKGSLKSSENGVKRQARSRVPPRFAPLCLRPRPRYPLISVKYTRTLLRSRRIRGNFVTDKLDVFVTMSQQMRVQYWYKVKIGVHTDHT